MLGPHHKDAATLGHDHDFRAATHTQGYVVRRPVGALDSATLNQRLPVTHHGTDEHRLGLFCFQNFRSSISTSYLFSTKPPDLTPHPPYFDKAMENIPYDIWHSVTTFLPAQEVKKLYSVNRSLHNIAMDERYRTIFIGSFADERTRWNIKRLVDPEISSRVRELTFKPGYICKALYESAMIRSEKTLDDPVSNLVDAFGDMNIKSQSSEQFYSPSLHDVLPLPAHWTQRNLLKILKQLISLTSLQVVIRGDEHWHFQKLSTASAFFAAGWSAFSNTLTSLELRVPLEDISKILPPAESLPLKNLEKLSLQIVRASLSTDTSATMLKTLLPMINQHRTTLRVLTLDVKEGFDALLFLHSITHLKRLQSFALIQSFISQVNLSGLKHFFQVHHSQLTDVSLQIVPIFGHYPIHYTFFGQDCFKVTLPKLHRISINFQGFPPKYSEGLIPYIHKFKASLVSLEVSEHRWSLQQLTSLVEGFPSDSNLRDLKISIILLEPKVFQVLADKLPKLDTLNIDFYTFGPVGYIDSPINTVPRFTEEIHRMNISNWALRKLDLSPISLEMKLSLTDAFPKVESFCGLTPMEYISEV